VSDTNSMPAFRKAYGHGELEPVGAPYGDVPLAGDPPDPHQTVTPVNGRALERHWGA